MWTGEYSFVMAKLIEKDFKIRYRNMSLGVFWSLLNPLVMMGVMTFVLTKIFDNRSLARFPVFVLWCLVPFNFVPIAWATGTTSLVDNAALIKRVTVPREIILLSSVFSNCVHLLIQICLLFTFVFLSGGVPNRHWVWLPFVWGMEVIFVCGISLITASLNVFLRDIRYAVESVNVVLFWLVPIFYNPAIIPNQYKEIYQLNPVAAQVWALRYILLDAVSPPASLLIKLTL